MMTDIYYHRRFDFSEETFGTSFRLYSIYWGKIMNEKTLIISILAIVLIILASLSTVVGTNVIKSNNEKENIPSPLFTIRTQRFIEKDNPKMIQSQYIGKDNTLNIFLFSDKIQYNAVNKALKLLGKNPLLSNQLIDKLVANQIFINFLRDNDISISEFKTYLSLIENEPLLLEEKIRTNQLKIPKSALNEIMPLGLETTDPIGCFITALALAIIAVIFALIISTLTIITCLNIGGCFEIIGQKILDNIAQGLIPPGY